MCYHKVGLIRTHLSNVIKNSAKEDFFHFLELLPLGFESEDICFLV